MENIKNNRNNLNIHFQHQVIIKAPGLLDMMYRGCEISGELGVSDRVVAEWTKIGLPTEKDKQGHLWINGMEAKNWILENKKRKATGRKLEDDEAFCMKCKCIVKFPSIEVKHIKGSLIHIKGNCPICGTKINRGGRND
jgi:hypothetical protein